MIKAINNKTILTLLILFASEISNASVGVPTPDYHISKAQEIVIGTFEQVEPEKITFIVEQTLKGDIRQGSRLKVDENSRIISEPVIGGGMRLVSKQEFLKQIVVEQWFSSPVILLGSYENEHWVNECYHWSIWPYNEIEFKEKSIEDVERYIKERISEDKQVVELDSYSDNIPSLNSSENLGDSAEQVKMSVEEVLATSGVESAPVVEGLKPELASVVEPEVDEPKKNNNTLYFLFGILLLGAIAYFASGAIRNNNKKEPRA